VNLTTDDVDMKERTIYVPPGKGARDRIIPISVSTSKVLKAYSKWRESVRDDARYFFIFDNPKVKFPDNLYRESFNSITEKMGLRTKKPSTSHWRNITVHDLRHTFAVKTLIKAYESNVDVHEAIVQLSSGWDIKISNIPIGTSSKFRNSLRAHLRGFRHERVSIITSLY